jgi:tetratricopeptide (TPR) repeat protein
VNWTVFLSYRRTNVPWALAIHQSLTRRGYDVFLDYTGIGSGDFEQIILANIRSRAHFLVLLTPTALERCNDPEDLFRREIEAALTLKRNIVPILLEECDFRSPAISARLTGSLELLKRYNALVVPPAYFEAAMTRLSETYLSIALEAVPHPPATDAASQAAKAQNEAVRTIPRVELNELTAQQWFERGFASKDRKQQIAFYSEALRLKPNYGTAYHNRGTAYDMLGDLDAAIRDYDHAIALIPDPLLSVINRGAAREEKGDRQGAIQDFTLAIHLDPTSAQAFTNRGAARHRIKDYHLALEDYNEAIRLNPHSGVAFYNRAFTRHALGDGAGAQYDLDQASRLGYPPKRPSG